VPKARRAKAKRTQSKRNPTNRRSTRPLSAAAQDAKFQREQDARTIQEAQRIQADPKRSSAAKTELSAQAVAANRALKQLKGKQVSEA